MQTCLERHGERAVRTTLAALLVAVVGMAAAPFASAQETRAEEIAKKQAEKAATAAPYKPNRFETFMNRLEENLASPPDGFFPAFGSIYPGGGFTLGAGYRNFFARQAVWDITGLYSLKNYKRLEFGMRTPWNGVGPWTIGFRGGWFDAPQVAYYGIGMDTPKGDRANFRVSGPYAGLNLTVLPVSWIRLEGDVSYQDQRLDSGSGRNPSIETLYDNATAPGLFAPDGAFSNPKFIVSQGTAAIDWRRSPGYSRTGGYYGVTVVNHTDTNETFDFTRVDGELIQHLPLMRENWVLSFRGRVQSILNDDDVVPFHLLPQLGSGSTLRGYTTGRFRDRHALLTTAEFRWIPNRMALDMAIFYDAGKVASRFEDLDFDGLKSDWGIGARFHGVRQTVLRIEGAKGEEGWRLVFSTNAAF